MGGSGDGGEVAGSHNKDRFAPFGLHGVPSQILSPETQILRRGTDR